MSDLEATYVHHRQAVAKANELSKDIVFAALSAANITILDAGAMCSFRVVVERDRLPYQFHHRRHLPFDLGSKRVGKGRASAYCVYLLSQALDLRFCLCPAELLLMHLQCFFRGRCRDRSLELQQSIQVIELARHLGAKFFIHGRAPGVGWRSPSHLRPEIKKYHSGFQTQGETAYPNRDLSLNLVAIHSSP
jgi:hypothetical protein